MKIAHKSLQTCRCKAAVRPKRTKSGTNNSGNNPDGKINLIAAIDSREVSRTVTSRNTFWQSNESIGTLNQTLHMTQVNVPVGSTNFQAAGGISVQLPKGAKLPQQIATLAKQPGNEYLGDLAKRSDIDWKQVEVINKTWDYKKAGITQETAIVVAIVVTIVTAGAASGAGAAMATAAGETVAVAATATTAAVAGTTAGAVIAGATSAAITTLATQAAIALLNNKGDIAGALKELGSKENVRGLATAVITAGLVQGIGVEFGLNNINAKSPFINQLGANLVNGVAGSLVSTAINGGSLEDNLKNAIKTALISTTGAQLANGIGNITNDNQLTQTDIEKFANKFAHAVLGCAVGAATADSQAGCGAGALGAVAGSLGAELFDPANVKGAQAQQFGKLTAALAVMLVGGDAKLMNIGGLTAVNAVANNRQLHPKEVNWIKENAAAYAKLKGISLVDAEKALAEQAFRQVQFGAEGGAEAWDVAASNFLLVNAPKLLLDPNNPNGGTGYMFRATIEQMKNDTMYAAHIGQTSDFYAKNGLNQPTATQVNNAFKKTEDRLNKMSAATIAAPVAATLLVGVPASLAATGATATAINGGMGFVTGAGMDAAGQMLTDGTVKPERVIFSGAVGAVSGPLGAQTGYLGNAAIGATGNVANTLFSNTLYGSTTDPYDAAYDAAFYGFIFGGVGAIGGNIAGNFLSSKPSMQGFTPNPKTPALLQAPWKPPSTIPALTNSGASGVIGGATFIPELINKKQQ